MRPRLGVEGAREMLISTYKKEKNVVGQGGRERKEMLKGSTNFMMKNQDQNLGLNGSKLINYM
jgi:hypothetical protein